jgi:trans-aconitate methyltransferase
MTTSATPRGLLFGTAAESYERFRLGYPDEVVDRTLAYAGHRVTRALEVGAGTGKATRAFASRGIQVTALEPDQDMFTVLERETMGMQVDPVLSTLEGYDGPPSDLVYAAASWHWTEPSTRWAHTADLLTEGGVVALFGSPVRIADPEVQAAVDAAASWPPGHESHPGRRWPGDELAESDLFVDVEEHVIARQVLLPQREYVGYLSTLSAYLELSLDERHDVLRRVAGVVPAQVRIDLTIRLFLARRA